MKHQLQFCHRLISNSGFFDDLSYGNILPAVHSVKDFKSFREYLSSVIFQLQLLFLDRDEWNAV